MRALITGGGGFLAGHLETYLRTVPDLEVRSVTRAECDLSQDRQTLSKLLRSFHPTFIFHLAGRINGSDRELYRDNDLASAVFLDAVQQDAPDARVVLGSTTALYGVRGSAAPCSEDDQPLAPRGDYARSKHAAEQHAKSYAQAGGWIVVARISNPVGPYMHTDLLCGMLADQVAEIERGLRTPVITLRDLTPRRDFMSVSDCARALWQLAQAGVPGNIYNVASGASVSIEEVVQIFLELARVRPIEVNLTSGQVERSPLKAQWISNSRLLDIGWRPQESLRQAISNLLDAGRDAA